MLLFLSAFFLVYGSLHWFFYRLLTAAWSPGRWRGPLLLFLLLMVLSPVLVRALERWAMEGPALWLAHIGFTWMGFIFLFTVLALLLLPLRGLSAWRRAAAAGRLRLPGDRPGYGFRLASPRGTFVAAFLVAVSASAYGYWEARDIRLEQVRLDSPKMAGFAPAITAGGAEEPAVWPPARPLRIVKITDLHLGLQIRERRLAPVLEVVRRARPDILVATGDIVDGQGDGIAHLAEQFRRLEAPLGKFAILGNHEFYIGAATAQNFLEEAGFTVLRGESIEIGGRLRIAGVDDRTGIMLGLTPPDQEERLLAGLAADTFNILLKHQPAIEPGGVVDLQLSGHIHRGQIFPFNFFTWLAYRVPSGLSRAADGRYLYVGRGAGTWGPPIRLLAPPEVTLLELGAEI
jgi:uncharacterized protein